MSRANKAAARRRPASISRRSVSRAGSVVERVRAATEETRKIGAVEELTGRVRDNNLSLNNSLNRLESLVARLQGHITNGEGGGADTPLPTSDLGKLNLAISDSAGLAARILDTITKLEEL